MTYSLGFGRMSHMAWGNSLNAIFSVSGYGDRPFHAFLCLNILAYRVRGTPIFHRFGDLTSCLDTLNSF